MRRQKRAIAARNSRTGSQNQNQEMSVGKRESVELTERRRDRIAELTSQGLSASQIAEIVGIHKRNVVVARRARGIAQNPRVCTLSDTEKTLAADLLADGASVVEVARTLGRSAHTIYRHFPGRGWTKLQVMEYARISRRARQLLS